MGLEIKVLLPDIDTVLFVLNLERDGKPIGPQTRVSKEIQVKTD